MESGQDCLSLASSIELKDALVDTKWFQPGETHSSKPTGDKWSKRIKEAEAITLEDYVVSRLPFYARWYEAYKVRSLNQRLEKFELDEIESFVKQKLHKITDVIADQGRKLRLFSSIAIKPNNVEITYRSSELKRKYGATLICWLDDVAAGLDQPSSEIIEKLLHGFTQFKAVDPLANWTKQGNEFYCRMLGRINTFASEMATMVNYSFIIEPGTITPHLSDYVAEFRHLETFFERNPLTPEESNQSAFNRNCNKVRNKLTECADISRVILQCDKSRDSSFSEKFVTGSSSCFLNAEDSMHENSNDFIHASYVRGGPLLNTFILTQAPLLSTIADFWQMVWQERSHYIVMLCKAVDVSTLGLLDGALPNVCPYYWPRYENDEVQYGNFIISNCKIDYTADPLFNVTYLTIRRVDGKDNYIHEFEHWQYDWNDFTDYHWPFRILRRARLAPTPTIIQCLDGCGRSGTLVTIEVLLMLLLRGSACYSKLLPTTTIFVRLQRRHAISSPLQYLFIYRTLLYWMQPFITSITTRFILGLIWPEWGFIGKYQKMLSSRRKFQ